MRINASAQNVPKEEYIVTGLEEGAQYKFRIIAKTVINISEPSEESDAIAVIAEHGNSSFTYIIYNPISKKVGMLCKI